jgi:hypothetical protein
MSTPEMALVVDLEERNNNVTTATTKPTAFAGDNNNNNNHQLIAIESQPSQNLTDIDDEKTLRTIQFGFVSNIILLLGLICNVIFSCYEVTGQDREPIAIIIYFVAFTLLLISAMIELYVDVWFTRVGIKHGRYYSMHTKWDIIISILFIIGLSVDIIAFIFWRDFQLEIEKNLLFVSAYTLLIMTIIVMYFVIISELQCCNKGNVTTPPLGDNNNNNTNTNTNNNNNNISNKLDAVANTIFSFGVILNIIVRHFEKDPSIDEGVSKTTELFLSIIWCISGLLYVGADATLLAYYFRYHTATSSSSSES